MRVVFLLLTLLSTVLGERFIKTTSLLTCMENSQLTASYMNVKFYPSNNTVEFDIQALTTITADNVIAKITLIVYGLNVVNKELDLCDLGLNQLCPLTAGRIDVTSNYKVSTSITKDIPGVAYTVPDLDARIRVVAYNKNDTNTPLACVEAVLSNGKTVQTKYASWPIAAISGAGLIVSGIVSIIGHSTTAAHIASNSISLFVYFQNLAITSMMAVSKVPPIAAAWTQNFQWSMGIINVEFMQKAIRWYIEATGGTSTAVIKNEDILSISVQKRSLVEQAFENSVEIIRRASSNSTVFTDSLDDDTLYSTDEHDTTSLTSKILVLRGMQRVSYLAGIEISNFFLTGIVFFLFFLFVLIVALMSFKGLIELLIRSNVMKKHKFNEYRQHWGTIIKGTLFRLALISLPQISTLSLWEFTEHDSAATVIVAAFMLVIILGLLLYGCIRVIMVGRESTKLYKTPAYLLYGNSKFLNRFGFLYVQFQAEHYWWLVPLLAYTFVRSIMVALVQSQGKAQALVIFIVEIFYFAALCWKRPFMDKRTNIFNIFIHLVTCFNSIMFLFFSNIFKQPAVVSSVCAVVLFVVNAIFALFLLIFTIVTCTLALIYKNPDAKYQPMKDDRVSFIPRTTEMEKSNKKDTELLALGETVMSGQQQQRNILQDSDSDDFGGKLAGSSSSKLFGATANENTISRSRSDSLSSSNQVYPSSAVMGTNTNITRPGISFADTSYKGASSSTLKFTNNGNSYNSNNNDEDYNPYNRARQQYGGRI